MVALSGFGKLVLPEINIAKGKIRVGSNLPEFLVRICFYNLI